MRTTKGGLIGQKQEMTKIWIEDKQVPVTLVKLCTQEIIRYKTLENDGYSAVVVGVNKQTLEKEKGQKVKYTMVTEFKVDPSFVDAHPVGSSLTADDLADCTSLRVVARSKGKGFQGVMKRHNFAGGPATHGSKFHRAGGSTGNRKPRRTIRGWKMAGHMGDETVTLRSVPLLDIWHHEEGTYLVMKGSLPGCYSGYMQLILS